MTDTDDLGRLSALAEACGFDHTGPLSMDALRFLPEVRDMCGADKCRSYGRNWSCPPACGSLEEIARRVAHYGRGLLVQTTAMLEDDFDLEGMMEGEKVHKQRFLRFAAGAKQQLPDCYPMAAGACGLCPACTYPDAPCRHPEQMFPSMEACGLFVSDVCSRSGLAYYYGKGTITYTSCILIP